MLFSMFVQNYFEPGVLPTLKFATQESYSFFLRKHLNPRFGEHRLRDISRVEAQAGIRMGNHKPHAEFAQ
jgi:hypothetical protein